MKTTRQRYIVYSQLCFFMGMLFCIFIKPKGLAANAGISYYGTFIKTVLPYATGILGSAYFTFRIAKSLYKSSYTFVRNALFVISIFSIGIVITPYSVNSFLNWTHTILGSVIFILQLLLSGWLIKTIRGNSNMLILWVLELTCGVIAAIYILPPHGFLIQSQLLFQLLFGIIMYRSFNSNKLVSVKQLVSFNNR